MTIVFIHVSGFADQSVDVGELKEYFADQPL